MASTWIVFILFMFLFPLCSLAQNDGTVAIGSILTADEASTPWLSRSGDFAFGFKQLQDKDDQFLLSIWFDKIPDKTIVWYVNSSNSVPQGSTVELDGQRGLILRGPDGQELWSTDGIFNGVDHGFLNDTGNFILKGNDDNSWLWESFGFPSDTILPTQELSIGYFLNSRRSENNFSAGRFYLHFRSDGNLVLTTQSLPTNINEDAQYYESGTASDHPKDSSNSGHRVIFNNSGSMYIMKRNNQAKHLSPASIPSASENFHKATLDFNGVFTHYYHPKIFTGNPNWKVLWSVPENICKSIRGYKGSGACGFNSICRLINERSPVCECPPGYILVDPNDKYSNCKPNYTLSCDGVEQGSAADLYDFVEENDVDWPFSDYEKINPANQSVCRRSCLEDCFCAVAIFRRNSCWKKRVPLSNGKRDSTLNSTAFIKYRKTDAPLLYPSLPGGSRQKDRRSTLILVGSVLLGSSLFGLACLSFYLIYQKHNVYCHPKISATETNLRCFTFKELTEATYGFREELGRGSFGIVYRGDLTMSSGDINTVAVKKLDRMAQDAEKQFHTELNSIGQTNHKNLVRLLGFCDEGQHRLLVYEYMSNGSLASFIFSNHKPSWNLRTQIAIGIARGLEYLHEECSTQIIHCDIKPQNILLDDDYNARICDFGLAKLLGINQSRTSLSYIRGTRGYFAPEWWRSTQITAKVDVYSFGVLLLEIISCRRSWDCFQEQRLDAFVQNDVEALNDKMMLERFVMVGVWCIQENPSMRPTMRKVSQMLEGIVEVPVPPCP